MPNDLRRRLIALYAELGAHTEPECAGNRCPKPLSCCAPMYCDLASDFAREHWGVKLEPGWHPTLPFMGPIGAVRVGRVEGFRQSEVEDLHGTVRAQLDVRRLQVAVNDTCTVGRC